MTNKKQWVLFITLAAVLLLSACSAPGSGSQSAQQVLQKSLTTMKQLKSVHVDVKLASTINMSSSSSSSSASQPFTVNVTANGDEVMPDKNSMHLTLAQAFTLSEITLGKKVYIQNMQGQWYVLDASKLKGSPSNLFASANASTYNQLLAIAQKATYTDHGVQTLNGASLRHITVTFGKDALKDLLNASGQANTLSALQRQRIDTALNNIQLEHPTLDVWVDEATSYVHQMELKFGLDVNTSSFKGSNASTRTASLPAHIKATVDAIINYNKFNVPVTITAPSNAIPANNPSTVFGFKST